MWFFHLKEMINLLDIEWDLGEQESGSDGRVCAKLYLFEILGEADKIYVKTKRGKLVGFAGYTKWNSKKHFIRKKLFEYLSKRLLNSNKIKNKSKIEEYNSYYDTIPEELEGYFDGELSILIVDRNERNKGYGKELIQKCFIGAKKAGIKTFQISTDETCNYKFYEIMGCKKIKEYVIPVGEPGREKEENYIFEKIL